MPPKLHCSACEVRARHPLIVTIVGSRNVGFRKHSGRPVGHHRTIDPACLGCSSGCHACRGASLPRLSCSRRVSLVHAGSLVQMHVGSFADFPAKILTASDLWQRLLELQDRSPVLSNLADPMFDCLTGGKGHSVPP